MSKDELVKIATGVRNNAYAPYSKFAVGAAVLTKSGKVFCGCNVENASFGLTICAERSAASAAVAAGCQDLSLVAVVTDSKKPALPCGACRQVLAEFNPELRIVSVTLGGKCEEYRLDELLPKAKQGILDGNSNV